MPAYISQLCLIFLCCTMSVVAEEPFAFQNVTQEAGILPAAANIRGHAAGWGDVDNNGWVDLYIGTFHNDKTQANMLFRNTEGKFTLDSDPTLRISTRANSGLFADLDNDGDLDLYVSSMPASTGSKLATKEGLAILGCTLFRNDAGKFTNISENNAACPAAFGGRSATALDFNGDGLLDLLVGEDPLPGYNGSATKSTRLFQNMGHLEFKDVSQAAGIPEGTPGLGVLAADFNNDTWPDIFLACHVNSNILLLNNGTGKFDATPELTPVFAWENAKGDNMVCGVASGDINCDGWLDLVLCQHFDSPWREPVANRLYVHRGLGLNGNHPTFENVTEQVEMLPLPMKAPHSELQDFNNDGLLDISTSLVKFANGKCYPVIYQNSGIKNGLPRFSTPALAVNDFPTEADRNTKRSTTLFEKMIAEKKIIYAAPGPTADFNNDGKLDMFLASWWPEAESLLLKNETTSGNWLQVEVVGAGKMNRMGIGAHVLVYKTGDIGNKKLLLGMREIAVGYGYVSCQPAYAHFGLGAETKVDIEIILPHGHGKIVKRNVNANQRIQIQQSSKQ
jgi:enediyne biosynthesis protein E4